MYAVITSHSLTDLFTFSYSVQSNIQDIQPQKLLVLVSRFLVLYIPFNSNGHMKIEPRFKVSSERLEKPDPEVIKPFSCSTQLSVKFEHLIITEIVQIS